MSRRSIIVLFIIVIFALFFRTYRLNDLPPGLYHDEAMNGNNALEALATGHFKLFYPENAGREGLFINIQALSIYLFGNTAWALRIVSALFGTLTVAGFFFLGREVFEGDESTAAFGSFFLATSFWHIIFSRIGFRAIMAPCLLVWSMSFLLKSLRLARDMNRVQNALATPKLPGFAFFGGVLYGLGFHTYPAYRATFLIPVSIIIFYLKNHREAQKPVLRRTLSFGCGAFLTAAPLLLYFLMNPGFSIRMAQVSIFKSNNPMDNLMQNTLKTIGMLFFSGDTNWRHNYSGDPELWWPVSILTIWGVFRLLRSGGFYSGKIILPGLAICMMTICALLPCMYSTGGVPHALRSILLILPVFLCAGLGASGLYKYLLLNLRSRAFLNSILLIFILITCFQTYYKYFELWGPNNKVRTVFSSDSAKIARRIKQLPVKLPKYVVVEGYGNNPDNWQIATQPVMYLTNSYLPAQQKKNHIFYIAPSQIHNVPENSTIFHQYRNREE